MYGDFSRRIGDQHKHYAQLQQQQGRLPLDADFNELGESVFRYLHQLVIDVIGPYGTAVGTTGFEATWRDGRIAIGNGFYYVQGRRCEYTGRQTSRGETAPHRGRPHVLRSNVAFLEQPPPHDTPYLIFLRAWERTVTSAQDGDLADVAFDHHGDTVVRSQVVWQVLASRTLPDGRELRLPNPNEDVDDDEYYHHHHPHHHGDERHREGSREGWEHDHGERERERELRRLRRLGRHVLGEWEEYEEDLAERRRLSRGALRAEIVPGSLPDVRNELHRVEVHHGGTPKECSFKHSRDNGSTVFRFAALAEDRQASPKAGQGADDPFELDVLGTSDAVQSLAPGLWLEYVDDYGRLPGEAPMLEVLAVQQVATREGRARLSVRGHLPDPLEADLQPVLRQWDHYLFGDQLAWTDVGNHQEATLPLGDVLTATIRTGRQPFHRGDHWPLLTRSRAGGLVTSQDGADPSTFEPPERFDYHDAPLAVVTRAGHAVDLRSTFYGSAIWEPRLPERRER